MLHIKVLYVRFEALYEHIPNLCALSLDTERNELHQSKYAQIHRMEQLNLTLATYLSSKQSIDGVLLANPRGKPLFGRYI